MTENQSGGIIRVRKDSGQLGYKILASYPANDSKLSWKARGILWYLLEKPDNWKVIISDLVNKSEKDGEAAVRSALKELQDNGYIRRYQERGERGKFGTWVTEVYELPFEVQVVTSARQPSDDETSFEDSPHGDYPNAARPDADNRGLLNKKYTKYELDLKREEEEGGGKSDFEDRLKNAFFDVFSHKPSGEQVKLLLAYLDWMEEEVILYSLQQTSKNSGMALKYTLRILDSWREKGVRTLIEAKEAVRQYEVQKSQKRSGVQKNIGGETSKKYKWQQEKTNFNRFLRNGGSKPTQWHNTIDFTKFREN